MHIDVSLFMDMLNIDSTSGRERALAEMLEKELAGCGCKVTRIPADAKDGEPVNLLFAWGEPRITFCTHLDTVPPYIPPKIDATDGNVLWGRGTCDAKGQIISMYTACRALAEKGESGFGLLLLYGEETGSYGAKAMRDYPGGEVVIVGEPTDGCMASASKGTKSFEVTITGQACHSGYPEHGISAIEIFVDMVEKIRAHKMPVDPVMGNTTYNIGKLISDNPQNILSPELKCRIYWRTTEASDQEVGRFMESLTDDHISIQAFGGDTPSRYLTLPGFETTTVAFGSDAPQLTNYKHKALCGAGSILVAHKPDEHIRLDQLDAAAQGYVDMYHMLKQKLDEQANDTFQQKTNN